ncbi:hypothetical protein K443DRAFT_595163 [Laccaria amethystina LaAM-08-1]|uniref:Uncharacterized protein n=1 Tax=Laccaria amethystina LaAM-08-1 TaxID=1095629 RepID=A0A0C9XST0_9AGAR|nr:hypothetical protein K443DRAFT_595163 [Laccaria amethystina LaAM-08-1]
MAHAEKTLSTDLILYEFSQLTLPHQDSTRQSSVSWVYWRNGYPFTTTIDEDPSYNCEAFSMPA